MEHWNRDRLRRRMGPSGRLVPGLPEPLRHSRRIRRWARRGCAHRNGPDGCQGQGRGRGSGRTLQLRQGGRGVHLVPAHGDRAAGHCRYRVQVGDAEWRCARRPRRLGAFCRGSGGCPGVQGESHQRRWDCHKPHTGFTSEHRGGFPLRGDRHGLAADRSRTSLRLGPNQSVECGSRFGHRRHPRQDLPCRVGLVGHSVPRGVRDDNGCKCRPGLSDTGRHEP